MKATDADEPLGGIDDDPREVASRPEVTADFSSGSPLADGNMAASVRVATREPKEMAPGSAVEAVPVPGYKIESILGRGGMGVVYKAQHLALKRTVALKMVLAGGHAGPRELARFRIEAEAVARLQHPNIVQIHDVGEAGGHPYCALEFVEGGNLGSKLRGKPMAPKEAAKLVKTLARAMQLAHSRNVVHRDLKPANILLTTDGTPKITDFGIARQLDSDSSETQVGAVMGTPSYMAPEQASGSSNKAGPAADVYALGAILYECLTGRPPFKGRTIVETLDAVRTQEPTAPSRWQPGVPFDLETICLKCLRKEPENRYTSAAGLENDLVRFLNGEPIQARPVGQFERAVKWARRNPGVAASLVGLLGSFLAAFVLISMSYVDTERARKEEFNQRQAADKARDRAKENERAERWGRYRANIAAASASLQLQNTASAGRLLEEAPEEHRSWEWHHLHKQLDGAILVVPVPGGNIRSCEINPTGQQIAVACFDHNEVYLYDVATGRLDAVLRGHAASVTCVKYRPDGKQVATCCSDQTIRIWDPATGQPVALFKAKAAPSQSDRFPIISYNTDGSRILYSGDGKQGSRGLVDSDARAGAARMWDAVVGKEIPITGKWQESAATIGFAPDGKRFAMGSREYCHLCDALTGRELALMGPHANTVGYLAYSADGKRIASTQVYTADTERTVNTKALDFNAIYLWDGESGKEVAVLRGHTGYVESVRFSPDGARLVSGATYPENTARLWDAATGRLVAELVGHKNTIMATAFSLDGKRVVTSSLDQTARLWDGHTGALVAILGGHTGSVRHVLFSPNGRSVVTASEDATLRLWEAQSGNLIAVLRGHGDGFNWQCPPVFTPDSARLVSASTDGSVRIWDMSQVERSGILLGHQSYVYDVAFSPNGEQVASAAWDGTARLWDASTGRQTDLLQHETRIISSVAYNRDGSRLATGEGRQSVRVWEVAFQKAPRELWSVPAAFEEGGRATLNPAGGLLAATSTDGPVRLWDLTTKQAIARLEGHDKASIDLAFHPKGTLLATAGFDRTIRLWDIATHASVAILRGHTDNVTRLAFSTDGKILASGSSDKTICLWDSETHKKLAVMRAGSVVYSVAFSPDGKRLAAGCRDNTIRLFDIARGEQVAELQGHTDYVHAVAWSADGTRLVSGSGDFTVRLWDSLSAQKRAVSNKAAGRR